jgi:hypothetical protein
MKPLPSFSLFNYLVVGKVEEQDVVIPFASVGDLDRYLEHMTWAGTHLNAKIHLSCYFNGEAIGSVVFEGSVH